MNNSTQTTTNLLNHDDLSSEDVSHHCANNAAHLAVVPHEEILNFGTSGHFAVVSSSSVKNLQVATNPITTASFHGKNSIYSHFNLDLPWLLHHLTMACVIPGLAHSS